MNILTESDLKELIQREKGICASIYLRTYRAGKDTEQNSIVFKNLIRKVEKGMQEAGYRKRQIDSLMEEPRRLMDDLPFWNNQSDGLAAFISEQGFSYHRFPLNFESISVTGKRFHLKPLLPMLSDDGRFYLLALNLKGIRLFQGTHYSISEISLKGVPDSLEEALRYDDPERQIQYHSGVSSQGSGVRYKPTFHGQGVTDEDKKNILRFFQKVNKGVHSLLARENNPLVLAGAEHLLPVYREANDYSYLVEESITGNPRDREIEELHRQAWELVSPLFRKKQREAAESYLALSGGDEDKTSGDLREVVTSAQSGRVGTLFVPLEQHVWGSFDPGSGEIKMDEQETVFNDDLIDLAAVQTLFHGGTVFAVRQEDMPGDEEDVAAIYRF